jgi:hypothetical protein
MMYILLIILGFYLTILLKILVDRSIKPSKNSLEFYNSSNVIKKTEESRDVTSEFLDKCESLKHDLILDKFVDSDYLYINSESKEALIQLKKIIDENKLIFINKLSVSTAYYECFLIAILQVQSCRDSVFFRWSNSMIGHEIINIIFENDCLIRPMIRTNGFWFELTRVLISQDKNFSVLHGLSKEPGLKILKKINSVINPSAVTPGLKMRILKVALTSTVNSTSVPENSVRAEFKKRSSKSEVQIVKQFKENCIPRNSWYLFDGNKVKQKPIAPSKLLITKVDLPTIIKPAMQVGQSIILRSLFEKSNDKQRCNVLSAELISNKIGNLFDIPGFFDVFLKLEARVAPIGSISRAESIFYYWIKWDCMLPILKKMIEKESDKSRLISHGLFNKALMTLSTDNLSSLHLLFQKKPLKFLVFHFKEQIKLCIKNDALAFILLCLQPTSDRKNNKSCLLADMASFDFELFKELFSEENTGALISAVQQVEFVSGTPYLVTKLDQLYSLHPCHFISSLIEKNRNNLLRILTDEADGFVELVRDKKNNRKLLAEAFQSTVFRAAWNQLVLKDETLDCILKITKEQINSGIKVHEFYLRDLFDAIWSHPQVSIKIQEQKFRLLDQIVVAPPRLKKLVIELPHESSVITCSQEPSFDSLVDVVSESTQKITGLLERSDDVILSKSIVDLSNALEPSIIFQEVDDYLRASIKPACVAKKIIQSLCKSFSSCVEKEATIDAILQLLKTMPMPDIISLSQSSEQAISKFFEYYMWDKVEKQAGMIRPVNGAYDVRHFLPPELFDFMCYFETLLRLNQNIERKQLALVGSQIWKPFFDVTRDIDVECFVEAKSLSVVSHIISELIHFIKIQKHITILSNQVIGKKDEKTTIGRSVLLKLALPGLGSPQGYYSIDLKINVDIELIQKQMQKSLLGRRLTTDALLLINENYFSLFTCPNRLMEFWSCAPNADDFSYAFYVISEGVHHTYADHFTRQLAEFFELAHGADNVLKRTLLIPAIQQFMKKLASKNHPVDIIFNKLEAIKDYFLFVGKQSDVEIESTISIQRHERWMALISELSESQMLKESFGHHLSGTFFSAPVLNPSHIPAIRHSTTLQLLLHNK